MLSIVGGVCVPDLTGDVPYLELESVTKLKAPEGCHGLGWLPRDHAPYRSRRRAAGSHVSSSPLLEKEQTIERNGWVVGVQPTRGTKQRQQQQQLRGTKETEVVGQGDEINGRASTREVEAAAALPPAPPAE